MQLSGNTGNPQGKDGENLESPEEALALPPGPPCTVVHADRGHAERRVVAPSVQMCQGVNLSGELSSPYEQIHPW